jgi:hypothetical protein
MNISIDASDRLTFLELWAKYQRRLGRLMVVDPPMSGPNPHGDVTFYRLPREFLSLLRESGIPHKAD